MDWRDLALKAAEQINDENWIQGRWWEDKDGQTIRNDQLQTTGVLQRNTMQWAYANEQPSKACAVGHLYWVAQDQGLTFEEAYVLAEQVEGPIARNSCDGSQRCPSSHRIRGRRTIQIHRNAAMMSECACCSTRTMRTLHWAASPKLADPRHISD